MPTSAQPPQPISAPANPARLSRKMSTSQAALRVPTIGSRTNATPMSFGAAMSGISFTDGGAFSFGNGGGVPGSYGARFYGDAGGDSPHIPFSSSITMDPGSFAASSAAFGLPIAGASSYTRRSYAMAVSYGKEYNPNMLSASLASLTTGNSMGLGSLGYSYSRNQLETLRSLRNNEDLNQDYECCGTHHNGLHALLEHVEDQHPYTDSAMPDAGFSPVTLAMDLDLGEGDGDGEVPSATHSNRSSTSPRPVPHYPLTPTSGAGPKPDAPAQVPATIAPLQLSDVLKSPPTDDSTLALPSTSPDMLLTPTQSTRSSPTQSSPFGAAPKITQASRSAFLSGPAKTGPNRFDRAFNEVVAGKAGLTDDPAQPPGPTAVAPGVLFTAAAAMGIPSAPSVVGRQNGTVGNGTVTPTATTGATEEATKTTETEATADATKAGEEKPANGDKPKVPEPQLPQPSLFTTHKAWRCPNPGCNKAYKQSNGLKYHLQKGQCDFAIHDAIDHGLTLEEAEERSRPYVCAVGAGCNKRYRQMNGLKYHYLNSGEHGEYGLRMLQNGTHPHPPSHPPVPKRDRTGQANMREAVRNGAAPYNVPAPAGVPARPSPAPTGHTVGGAQAPRMGTWPTPQRPANGTAAPAATTTATANAAAPAPRPAGVVGAGVAATTAVPGTAAAARPAVPAAAAAPKMAPVQRGRDAVLFANIDPLDV